MPQLYVIVVVLCFFQAVTRIGGLFQTGAEALRPWKHVAIYWDNNGVYSEETLMMRFRGSPDKNRITFAFVYQCLSVFACNKKFHEFFRSLSVKQLSTCNKGY